MLEKNIKSFIDELIKEVEDELDEANVTGNVDGYDTPNAFSGKNSDKKRKKTATQFGYTLVNNDINNIDESVNEASLQKGKTYGGSKCEGGCFIGKEGLKKIIKISKDSPKDVFMFRDDNYSGLQPHFIKDGVIAKATVINPAYDLEKHKVSNLKIGNDVILSVRLFVSTNESISEGKKIQRPVNRWLELKNDESMHANKKLATGLRELKYQLKEVETFFRWYNQIKTMNELSSDTFWKRTHGHIYKIKERLINIAKTIQEIEK